MAPGRLLISESGIADRSDVERLSPLVDGFLIGSSLMRASEPAQAARELIFGRTKLCGLNCGTDVRAARPATFAGFVFVPGSPRHVTAQQAPPLAGTVRKSGVLPVGIFRDVPMSTVSDLATLMSLHAIQLHGYEDVEYVRALRRELPAACEIWTALSVGREPLTSRGGDRLVFDNADGGSGRAFDWSLVKDHPHLRHALVAGGISPHNAAAARGLGAYAIDVGSAVDLRPGKKSADKIGALFDALRAPSRRRLRACA
jgi:indole-3-glycerol phosphate synthase/phosphoribosylanthranilate isomerase